MAIRVNKEEPKEGGGDPNLPKSVAKIIKDHKEGLKNASKLKEEDCFAYPANQAAVQIDKEEEAKADKKMPKSVAKIIKDAADAKKNASKIAAKDIKFEAGNHVFNAAADLYGGFQEGQRFMLKSLMYGNKVMYFDQQEPIADPLTDAHSDQFHVKIRESQGSNNEWWRWNEEDNTIRSLANSNLAISYQRAGFGKQSIVVQPASRLNDTVSNWQWNYQKETN